MRDSYSGAWELSTMASLMRQQPAAAIWAIAMSGAGGRRSDDVKSSLATMMTVEGEIDGGKGNGRVQKCDTKRYWKRSWCGSEGGPRCSFMSKRLSPATVVAYGHKERDWHGRRNCCYVGIRRIHM
ncbi:uncharacterized protein DS421_7g213770 [Arachis hypogaea]|nr:uncharacterized protein DS421_7g213770 [Arachis hypogaea]